MYFHWMKNPCYFIALIVDKKSKIYGKLMVWRILMRCINEVYEVKPILIYDVEKRQR